MATIYSNLSILLPTTKSFDEQPYIDFLAYPANSTFPFNESASIGTIKGVITTGSVSKGMQGRLNFYSSQNNLTGSKQILSMYFSGSNDEPRVGIGFDEAEEVLKTFEVKSKIESNKGTELLIRSSRTGSGANVGDEAGLINFIIDSASFEDITTTGSVATIKAIVDSVSPTNGVAGRLLFSVQRETDTAIDMLEMGYGGGSYADFYRTFTSRSFEIIDFNPQITATQNASFVLSNGINPYVIIRTDNPTTSNQGGLIQVNDKLGTGSIFLHGPTGEITASLISASTINADVFNLGNSFNLSGDISASNALVTDITVEGIASFNSVTSSAVESDFVLVNSSIQIGETTSLQETEVVIVLDTATLIDTFSTSSQYGAIYDYVLINSTTGSRIGQFMIIQDTSNIEFTDTSTATLGTDPSPPTLSASFDTNGNVDVFVLNGSGYTFKALAKIL